MFVQRAFATCELARLDELIARNPFVTLITSDADGLPVATQLPVIYRRDGDSVQIEGHFARANPQAKHADLPALIIVHGAHHYISASWYPDKTEQARVPTWNYSTAHLQGRLQLVEDEAAPCAHLAELFDYFESRNDSDWCFDADNHAERVQVRGLIGCRLVATRSDENAQEVARQMQNTLRGGPDAT